LVDRLTSEARSRLMSRVLNKNTAPERFVRSQLFKAGFRFRLNRRDLPGSPDIVLRKHKTVVFVHGCFWHGHDCKRGKRPDANKETWAKKIDRNIARDVAATTALEALGWRVFVVWSCTIKAQTEEIIERLRG